ncbi:uncharacterized protein LOC143910674 [Arctopsyche grandis]|uniref:uncharacterized protein LOC143910674 n=1 Tax=Arctopsyche grandis TaxID=121162 RepID=UPI00406D81AB
MGAKQSKRSVDITTDKDAVVVEGGEVAGAGGEGKLERIEDIDTLKPQLNGDTAHQEVEISEKEKKMQQQDEAPENEKDTCNEKDIILSPVTNGTHDDGETPKEIAESIESETNKKNNKEKVKKKKFSFRSFSFNKKDKQKPPKKEETNGECEKVPEEAAETPAPVLNESESKIETEATEKEIPKMEEKTPETPVTEPMTNGSSAPESPKEEIRQNGDAASVEESPVAVAEPAIVPEAAKPVEAVLEEPSVESLPMNGLKIEDAIEEAKATVESKIDAVISAPEPVLPEPVEVKPEIAETEVCVVKEKTEAAKSAEIAPPPLPANPPPSSLTIFAESTMAPHLVDKTVVGELPVVDVDASISSVPSTNPVNTATDNTQQPISETNVMPVCENTPDNVPSALPNEIIKNQSVPTPDAKAINSQIVPNKDEISTPLETASSVNETNEVVETCVISNIVENLAVVSTIVPETPVPENLAVVSTIVPETPVPENLAVVSTNEPEIIVLESKSELTTPPTQTVDDNKVVSDEIEKPVQEPVAVTESIPISNEAAPIVSDSKEILEVVEKSIEITSVESTPTAIEPNPVITNVSESIVTDAPPQLSDPVDVPITATEIKNELESAPIPTEEVKESSIASPESISNTDVPSAVNDSLPPTNAPESPLPERTPSDPDISETALVEPPSDSFPPPPPPASCPESMTEFSASESLPPPPSESSQPDTVLNSPTSEISDFPPKDLPSPVKNDQSIEIKDSNETEVSANIEPQVTQTTSPEMTIPPPAEVATETTTSNHVAESPVEEKKAEEMHNGLPPADATSQVKTVSDVIDTPAVVESTPAVAESAPAEVTTAAE